MNFFLPRWCIVGLSTCFACLSIQAADYCLRPGKQDRTHANSIVCCTTPNDWRGWKDDPRYPDRIKQLDAYSKSSLQTSASFHQPNCKIGPECPYLGLDTRGRDSHGQPDVEAGLRDFLNESEQPQDLSPRNRPCVVVTRFGSFQTANLGDLTIWQIRCPSGTEHFVTLLAQRDVLVTIDLGGPNGKGLVFKVDSLKELARSVRITDGSQVLPDIVEINIDHLSDAAIKQQVLQLTPVGTSIQEVCEVLQSRLYKEVHRNNGDLWIEIGSYSKPVSPRTTTKSWPPSEKEIRSHISDRVSLPPTIVVRAFWKFDKERKLHDIEIRRQVIEYKSKRALPAK